ncbi:hypothetical protein [Campylobacter sp. MG1]|uniref:hypothetical protein n=1 Tax=Campylobacter sp. MG1 TaxID=2976332 RepID=UPI00226CF552|nr:hypothetical protein [Campylobacter sp. MG1]
MIDILIDVVLIFCIIILLIANIFGEGVIDKLKAFQNKLDEKIKEIDMAKGKKQ